MSSFTEKRPKALSRDELKKLLNSAISGGAYIESFHARFDHTERQIDLNDVLHGLQQPDWRFGSPPRFDEDFWNWEYNIQTKDIEGYPLTVIVAVDPRNQSFEVLTRWNNE